MSCQSPPPQPRLWSDVDGGCVQHLGGTATNFPSSHPYYEGTGPLVYLEQSGEWVRVLAPIDRPLYDAVSAFWAIRLTMSVVLEPSAAAATAASTR